MRFGLREVIFILLLIGITVSSYFLIFKPRNEMRLAIREEYHKKQDKLQQLATLTRNQEDLSKDIDKLATAIKSFEDKLPSAREEGKVLMQVTEMASRNRMIIKSWRPDKMRPAAKYAELPIRMIVRGEFEGVYNFLQEIERLPRITRIPVLSIKTETTTGANKDKMDGSLDIEFTLNIYFDSSDSQKAPPASEKDKT